MREILMPPGWPAPKGYSNGVCVDAGRMIFVAGMVGWDAEQNFRSDDFVEQFRQALANSVAVLAEGGAGPEHVVRLNLYALDRREYLARRGELGHAYREVMGRNYPPMTFLEVKGLAEERARIEIEITAVLPAS